MSVAIIGGGPAGLAAAIELRRLGAGEVVVLERERASGGIPRHAVHQGFGLRDLHRAMTGPAYARRYSELAARAGVEIRTETMVTGWRPDGTLELTSAAGRILMRPEVTLLATGCRERPRSARLIPGSRPAGVMTTGTLQQLVHMNHSRPGRRAVIVGAEHVSFSAVATLAHAGARAVCTTTELDRHQSFAAFHLGATLRYRTRLMTATRISAIHGSPQVEAVELTNLHTHAVTTVACDTVVLTADWIPDHELAVAAGLELDPQTRGPAVDGAMRTSRRGVFAAGNVLHGAETADIAALEGRHAARQIVSYLREQRWPEHRVAILCQTPLGWIYPSVVSAGAASVPSRGYALRARAFLDRPKLEVTQDGRLLWEGQTRRLQPGRTQMIPDDIAARMEPSAGPLRIALA